MRGSGLCRPGMMGQRGAQHIPFSVGVCREGVGQQSRPRCPRLWSLPEGVNGILVLSWEEDVCFPRQFCASPVEH